VGVRQIHGHIRLPGKRHDGTAMLVHIYGTRYICIMVHLYYGDTWSHHSYSMVIHARNIVIHVRTMVMHVRTMVVHGRTCLYHGDIWW
jgi:hypothetical protein